MNLDLEIINPLEYEGWDELLHTFPDYSFFHSASWARVLYDSYHYKPLYFATIKNGNLKALMPVFEINSRLTGRRGVSLPFTDYCEPIIAEKIQLQDVIHSVLEYGKGAKWGSFEFRGGMRFNGETTPATSFYLHDLKLSSNEEKIFGNFRGSTQRNIKKAIKEGVKIEICNSLESIKEFCRLNCLTKKRQGIPVQPFHFFHNIYKHIISKKQGVVALASYKKELVAGAICFNYAKKGIFNYGASDKKYQSLRANNLLMWETVKWYSQYGFKSFCFGITDIDNSGLRQFKSGMATSEKITAYYKYDFQDESFVQDKATITHFRRKIFQKMPITFLRLSGSAFYKHFG